jgi:hypothetical protein
VSEPAPLTHLYTDFAGQRRKFELTLGKVGELERLANAGIGEIMLRLAAHTFRLSDVRESIRLGLEGGGTPEPEATALIKHYVDGAPLADHLKLAGDIVGAFVNGMKADAQGDPPKKDEAEIGPGPATSPPSTKPAD